LILEFCSSPSLSELEKLTTSSSFDKETLEEEEEEQIGRDEELDGVIYQPEIEIKKIEKYQVV